MAAVLVLLLALQMTLFEISRARCFSLVGEAICRVETRAPVVALTFDDGPTERGVELTRRVLRENGAHATFFLIGNEVAGREGLVRQLVADGHEIGNHSYSHPRMIFHWPGYYDDQISRADAILRRSGVPAPSLFRPPYGKKLIGLPNALARHNYRMIMWDVEDPPGATDPRAYAAHPPAPARCQATTTRSCGATPRRSQPSSVITIASSTCRPATPVMYSGVSRHSVMPVSSGSVWPGATSGGS